ncbi:MAG: hypothetical protein AMXMBFR64_49860 [Myxococcales bacterium]
MTHETASHSTANRAPTTGSAALDVRAAHSLETATPEALGDLIDQLARPGRPAPRLLLMFASSRHDRYTLSRGVKAAFPDTLVLGCTTMGEVGIAGWTTGGISALALGGDQLRVAAAVIDDLHSLHIDRTRHVMEAACGAVGTTPGAASADGCFGITLTDGLSGMEELLMAHMAAEAIGLPSVGGSAGDDYDMRETSIFHEDRALPGAAALLIVRWPAGFQVFHSHHYHPTDRRVVVTEADPLRRRVRELDGWPAVRVFADILEVPESRLRADPFGQLHRWRRSLAFLVGGQHTMRSVMSIDGDELVLGGAVDEGVVLTVMQAGDMLADSREAMAHVRGMLGRDIGALIQFNCGGRFIEARVSGIDRQVADATIIAPTAGFHTYGEQFGFMQVNETLTGVALARGAEGPVR